MKTNSDSGFTLVELMVVVTIVGILVAVAVPIFANAKRNHERTNCLAVQLALRDKLDAYWNENQQNPATLGQLEGFFPKDVVIGQYGKQVGIGTKVVSKCPNTGTVLIKFSGAEPTVTCPQHTP